MSKAFQQEEKTLQRQVTLADEGRKRRRGRLPYPTRGEGVAEAGNQTRGESSWEKLSLLIVNISSQDT